MEYFDVLDENRNFLNYTKARGSVLADNEYNQGSEVWIVKDNKVLMDKRSENKSHPGMWEVPGGCSLVGENTLTTIIREVNEEIGLSINPSDVVLLDTQIYKKQFVDIYSSNMDIDISSVKLQNEEVCEIKFVSLDEFMQMKKEGKIVPSVINRFKLIKDKLDIN